MIVTQKMIKLRLINSNDQLFFLFNLTMTIRVNKTNAKKMIANRIHNDVIISIQISVPATETFSTVRLQERKKINSLILQTIQVDRMFLQDLTNS